jgi:hypothetical protein
MITKKQKNNVVVELKNSNSLMFLKNLKKMFVYENK